jgi:hypothetical protein
MRTGICEKWAIEKILANGYATRQVNLMHQATRQGIDKFVWIEAVIARVDVSALRPARRQQ